MELLTTELIIAALSLTALEIVLGIDNLVFMSVLVGKLSAESQPRARITGLTMALAMRLALLGGIVWVASLTTTLFTAFGHAFNVRDLVMIGGGLFLLWKAAGEIHERLEVDEEDHAIKVKNTFTKVVFQIAVVNLVFSLDSIITAIGMTSSIAVMMFAVVVSTLVMLLAAKPLGDFMHSHPSMVMLSFAFLVLIGFMLIAEGFGQHIDKAIVYSAMAFATAAEVLNIFARKAAAKKVELKARLVAKDSAD
jgi:predicted tellurium resistance membrane protein TerC